MLVLARSRAAFVLAGVITVLAWSPSGASADSYRSASDDAGSSGLERAHAHNDYEQTARCTTR